MHVLTAKEPNGKHSLIPTVIKPKFAPTANCPVPNVHLVNSPMPRNVIPKLYNNTLLKKKKVFLPLQVPSR